jgi:hypothetical protein
MFYFENEQYPETKERSKGYTTLRDLPAKLCCALTAKLFADFDAD